MYLIHSATDSNCTIVNNTWDERDGAGLDPIPVSPRRQAASRTDEIFERGEVSG